MFETDTELKNHIQREHKKNLIEELNCKECFFQCSEEVELTEHMKLHMVKDTTKEGKKREPCNMMIAFSLGIHEELAKFGN